MAWEIAKGILIAVAIMAATPLVIIGVFKAIPTTIDLLRRYRKHIAISAGITVGLIVLSELASSASTRWVAVKIFTVIGIAVIVGLLLVARRQFNKGEDSNYASRLVMENDAPDHEREMRKRAQGVSSKYGL